MERGEFRGLRGSGEPLALGQDEFVDRDQWAANKVLQNAGMLPAWIEVAKEIDRLRDRLDALVAEQRRWLDGLATALDALTGQTGPRHRPGIESIQRRFLARAGGIADALRSRTERFNLIVPHAFLQRAPVRAERLLEPFQDAYLQQVALLGWGGVAVPPPLMLPETEPGVAQPLFPPIDGSEPETRAETSPDASEPDRREKLLDATRKLRKRRPVRDGIPLEWLASLNPLGHAADILRRKRAEEWLYLDDDE